MPRKIIISIILTLVVFGNITAQDKYADIRMKSIKTFMDAYNEQDYKQMKKPLFSLGKILISKKSLRKEFESYYNKFGKATIDTITYSSKYQYTAKISLERDTLERTFFSFIFSEKGKVEGFGFSQPTLIYPKQERTKRRDDFTDKVSTLIQKIT